MLALQALVAWLYVWFATAGTYGFAHRETDDYYDLLADAFLAGQLHLTVEPSPRLLQLPNPYDPAQNGPHRLRDASLYNGRYYLYWGPVPGLVHAAWKGLTGLPLGDGAGTLLFGLAGCLAFFMLARALRELAAPETPGWLVGMVYLCYAFGGVSLYLQVRADIYKEAILAGTSFTLAGLYIWLRALAGRGPLGPQLALAGLLFGLGFGSRFTLLSYAAGAGLVLVWQAARAPARATVSALLAFGLPAAGVLALLLLYNQARFGSPTEFGFSYQLMSIATGQESLPGGLHPMFAPLNAAKYLALTPSMLPWFPLLQFVNPPLTIVDVGSFRYVSETFSVPVPLLAPLAVLGALACGLPLLRPALRGRPGRPARAFVAAASIGLLFNLTLLLLFISSTMRYIQDFLPVALLLGGLVLWSAWPTARTRRAWRLAHAAITAAILAVSLGCAFGYAINHVGRVRPEPYLQLAYHFDQVVGAPARWVNPGGWADWYAATAQRRLLGPFYPERSTLRLMPPRGARATTLTVWSLLPSATLATVSIDGEQLFQGQLRPGQQRLRLARTVTAGPSGAVGVQLSFPEEPSRAEGSLWPVAVLGLEP